MDAIIDLLRRYGPIDGNSAEGVGVLLLAGGGFIAVIGFLLLLTKSFPEKSDESARNSEERFSIGGLVREVFLLEVYVRFFTFIMGALAIVASFKGWPHNKYQLVTFWSGVLTFTLGVALLVIY